MRLAETEHELAKVTIVSNENSVLHASDLKNLCIVYSAWMVSSDPSRVAPLVQEVVDEAGISTLIQEEPHTEAAELPGASKRSPRPLSLATAAWAYSNDAFTSSRVSSG